MVPSHSISVHVGIGLPRLPIGKSYSNDFRSGARSQLQPWPPEGRKREDHLSLAMVIAST
jgi:hypothetical protein